MAKQVNLVEIKFNFKFMIILTLIELITVPLVAMSNPWLQQSLVTILGFGFVIAAVGLALLLNLLKKYLLNNSEEVFGLRIKNITNLWLLILIAGILEMVMFAIQSVMFENNINVFLVGFGSAFGSVLIALIVYKLLAQFTPFAIKLVTDKSIFILNFTFIDIVFLSFLFGVYEFIVCPITGWWIPYTGLTRLGVAIASALIGAVSGFILLVVVKKTVRRPVFIMLNQLSSE